MGRPSITPENIAMKGDRACRVLVADDNRDAAESLAALLLLAGDYEVTTVCDGLQAVEAARAILPQVVILDIDMPVMNGYRAAALIRAQLPPDSPLVLVAFTARTDPLDVRTALLAGFDHHVGKPNLDGSLCGLIDSFVARATLRQAAGSVE